MKVTIYTTNDCQFCKQEKDYLASKNIAFEEKNVQSNREFLQEMLDVSNNFAGTPVTKIEKDDGQSVVLKGFTQSELDNALGTTVQAANSTMPAPTDSPPGNPSDDQGSQIPSDQPPTDQPTDMPVVPPTPEPVVPEPQVPVEETPASEPTVPESQEPQIPVETPNIETPTSDIPSRPNPLPPMPSDETTAAMESTIPIDPSSSNQPPTDSPTITPPSDQPSDVPAEPPATEPSVPENPVPEETPPPAATPEPQPEQSVNSDQKLDEILDSLKTKAEAISTPATPAA